MVKFTTRKKIFNFLVLITCLVISAGFVMEVKTYKAESVSVTIEQKNADIKVVVKAPKNTSVQFYMFSTDGNLVNQMEITGTKKFSIAHLSKGYYLYELFDNDERLKRGDIQVK